MRNRKILSCVQCSIVTQIVAHGLCRKCYSKIYHKTYSRPDNKITCLVCKQEINLGAHNMCGSCYKKYLRGNVNSDYDVVKNRLCATYLGIDVAETVLSSVYKRVEIMASGNKGYDFICNRGKKIDVKSSCLSNRRNDWNFNINKNEIADFFLCIAFDNRDDLNPHHLWLLPGWFVNYKYRVSISGSTISKWSDYELNLTKTIEQCNKLKLNTLI